MFGEEVKEPYRRNRSRLVIDNSLPIFTDESEDALGCMDAIIGGFTDAFKKEADLAFPITLQPYLIEVFVILTLMPFERQAQVK